MLAFDRKGAGAVETHCGTCKLRENVEQRHGWGCDGPTAAEPYLFFACLECRGEAPEVASCTECAGSGVHEIRECPSRLVGPAERWALQLASVCESGQFAFGGLGFAELPAPMVDAIAIVFGVRNECEREAAQRAGE